MIVKQTFYQQLLIEKHIQMQRVFPKEKEFINYLISKSNNTLLNTFSNRILLI